MGANPNNEKILAYLIENPEFLSSNYAKTAKLFNTTSEAVRHIARRYKNKQKTDGIEVEEFVSTEDPLKETSFRENVETGDATYTFNTTRRIKTKEDLIDLGLIDIANFEINSYEVGTWEGYRKAKHASLEWTEGVMDGYMHDTGKLLIETLYRVKVNLKRRVVDTDLQLQKQIIIDELKEYSPSYDVKESYEKYQKLNKEFDASLKKCALEINIPDLHLGKLAWAEETNGEDYDIKIAVKRYKEAVASLISRINISTIKKIILVVGHDYLNIDSKSNTTTAGTPQSNDSRFYKIVKVGKILLVETIDELSLIAPVDVIVVPGNHDSNSMLMMGDIIEAFYHKNPRVKVTNNAASRKYYQFGVMGLMYCHLHNEKINDLGIIFATENSRLWADTKYHRVHGGHFHHSKQIRIKDIQETPGCVVKIINSLSANDVWHADRGYLSSKGAEAFLYHEDQGLIANYYYQI